MWGIIKLSMYMKCIRRKGGRIKKKTLMYTSKFSELQVGKYKQISLYILVKMLKAKDKGRILKAVREK